MIIKRTDELRPDDRVRTTYGEQVVQSVEPTERDPEFGTLVVKFAPHIPPGPRSAYVDPHDTVPGRAVSAPTPQEIRDRLGLVESILSDISTDPNKVIPTQMAVDMCTAKATVLNAAVLTLLAEQQAVENQLTAAAVYVSLGDLATARAILKDTLHG